MAWPFIIPIVAIIAWAAVKIVEHGVKHGAQYQNPQADAEAQRLAARLEAVEHDRDRLRARVENLEAIVTSDPYELDRVARQALAPAAGTTTSAPQLTLEEPDDEDVERNEARAARLASRARGSV